MAYCCREEEIKVHVEVDEEGEVDTTGARNDVSSGPWNSQTVDPISGFYLVV